MVSDRGVCRNCVGTDELKSLFRQRRGEGSLVKSIIDVSVYITIMTIMCFISLDFILINAGLGRKQDAIEYISSYVEIYGTGTESETEDGNKTYVLDENVMKTVKDIAAERNMEVDITYQETTENYHYYRMVTSYMIHSGMLGIDKKQTSVCLVRTGVEES
jgi:hypothetical protein